MNGKFIDVLRTRYRKGYALNHPNIRLIETNYGKVRVLDTGENKQVIINVPDGPNVIEHHEQLIKKLSVNFRVVCFEFPGFGFSYPTPQFDYSLENSARLTLELMDILKIDRAALSFSCSNGFYAIKTTEIAPDRFTHLFLAQTPSLSAMHKWVEHTIPKIITVPVIGELTNSLMEKKFAHSWYKFALPKGADLSQYRKIALHSLNNGSCFCLSGLVQGLSKDMNSALESLEVPSTLVWGKKDYTHRHTNPKSVLEHVNTCEVIEFEDCGHFPELENTALYVQLINERLQ